MHSSTSTEKANNSQRFGKVCLRQEPPPLEDILVIFGHRALIFFLFECSWENMKYDTACAVVITLETQKCRKRAPRSFKIHFYIKRPVTLKQNRAILHPMMLVSIAIWESGDANLPRIVRCRIARPAAISIAWFCIKRFLYGFSKDCVPATHGSVKFVHCHWALVPCLTTPVLPALLFRREVERRFFFLCFDHG